MLTDFGKFATYHLNTFEKNSEKFQIETKQELKERKEKKVLETTVFMYKPYFSYIVKLKFTIL